MALWNEKAGGPVDITLVLAKDPRDAEFRAFCETIAETAPNIHVTIKKDEDEAYPHIQVRENISYFAIPSGPEFSPFLSALSEETDDGIKKMADKLKNLPMPAHADTFIAPGCPHCPKTVRQMVGIAVAQKKVKLSVIDGVLFKEWSDRYSVQSAPTVLIDESFRFTGMISIAEMVDVMIERDPAKLGEKTLEGMIKEGAASDISELMLQKKAIFPAFLTLLMHEKWPVRLGAMVVMEEIIEKNTALASEIVAPVIEKFSDLVPQTQGDMAYLLGECAPFETTSFLKDILEKEGEETELGEAAQEALERLQERFGR